MFTSAATAQIAAPLSPKGEKEIATEIENWNDRLQGAIRDNSKPKQFAILDYIGSLLAKRGDYPAAIQHYMEAVELAHAEGYKVGEADVLNDLSFIHDALGHPVEAIRCQIQALAILDAVQNRKDDEPDRQNFDAIPPEWRKLFIADNTEIILQRGNNSTNLAADYLKLGNRSLGQKFLQESLDCYRKVEDKRGEAYTLEILGSCQQEQGHVQEALALLDQALPLSKEVDDANLTGSVLHNIASIHRLAGRLDVALPIYQEALKWQEKAEDPSETVLTLAALGRIYTAKDNYQEAEALLEKSLAISQTQKYQRGETSALAALSTLAEKRGQLEKALEYQRAALTVLETQRTALGAFSDLKMSFLEANLPHYHRYIALLLKAGRQQEAFDWLEKTKARALLDMQLRGNIDPNVGLTTDERLQDNILRQKAADLNRELVAQYLEGQPDVQKIIVLKEQIVASQNDLAQWQNQRLSEQNSNPAKWNAQTITLSNLAERLPEETALLNYVILNPSPDEKAAGQTGETLLFCVTKKDGQPFLQVYSIKVPLDEIEDRITELRFALEHPNELFRLKSRQLYQILVAPAAAQITGLKRLVICPDGALWNFPFAALTVPQSDVEPQHFMLEDYELCSAFSATMAFREKKSTEKPQSTLPRTLLVVADPDFGTGSRLNPSAVTRSAVENAEHVIPALPGTRREAEALQREFPQAVILSGGKAQESEVARVARDFRVLHFATHSFYVDAAPWQSSIVLASPPKGADWDGFLTAREILDLSLKTDLVVLSACETGRGEQHGGEGLIGLTWAFTAAGAKNQIVSLWKVDDSATATLMKKFYEQLHVTNPASALRRAELSLISSNQYSHPYYWAPFIFMGPNYEAGAW
jgi:CHAT domain-containing protein